MIETKKLRKTYHDGQNENTVLKDVDLLIEEGEFTAIMGPSGAGKSTLLYQLGLLDHPTKGEILIDNLNTERLSQKERTNFRLHNLGFVFQDYALVPELTSTENVFLTLLMQGLDKSSARAQAQKILKQLGLGDRLNNLPSQLSGGEQQRVSVARAIAHNPKILYADEPTASLDSERSLELMKLFEELNTNGQTIIMVTHEPEFADFARRIVSLKDGNLVSDEKHHKHHKVK
jgi:putative ABC transport system ATP-binding protein